ncbi:unnamed protein product [Cylindrotheca closterium]|uniref:Zeta toxin domain-containing protein n=1 Tax=Cylindrotheca closterium TaxID=2856 RepID=A0AAD2CCS3_9STRA|nr:unnamed protein product [Cylindrotheca closterium]
MVFDTKKFFRRSEAQPPSKSSKKRNIIFRRKSLDHKKFSDVLSTEEYNAVDEPQYFGPYAHIRKQLDYTYHRHYRKERQWLQDSIIEDILDHDGDGVECVTPTQPWLIFTVGPRGAGKRQVIRDLTEQGRLGLLTHVGVDSDALRRRLPEYETYLKSRPDQVDNLTKKEAGLICEILTLAAIQAGRNVILDGSLSNVQWHLNLINRLKEEYKLLKFGIFNVTAPQKRIVKHAQKMAIATGRNFSRESIFRGMEAIPDAIEALRPVVDFVCEIHNNRSGYQLVDMDWDDFQVEFLQMSAWQPGMQGKQKRTVSRRQSIQAREATIRSSRVMRRRFSVLISSEENNASDDMTFFGKFSHIRKTLDYTYHSNYTFERQHLQDRIIIDMLDDAFIFDADGKVGTVPTEPWIVFTAGAMGCGKSHTMQTLVDKERFPLGSFVSVDPDEVRRLLPEYHMYINENAELAGELTRKEAGYIAEILTLAALQAGKNVLVDGSLRDSDWYTLYFKRLREDFPHVRQAIIHVTAPREAVFQRAASRALSTGRIVPIEVLEAALDQVPKSVKILAPQVDYYAEVNNPEKVPDVELVKPVGSTWEDFRKTWLQTVAYVPTKQRMAKVLQKKLRKSSFDNDDAVCNDFGNGDAKDTQS